MSAAAVAERTAPASRRATPAKGARPVAHAATGRVPVPATRPAAGGEQGARVPNRKGSGGQLRVEIIDAALRLLDTQPAEALSLRAVAKEARISPPAVYLQFDNRDDVMAAVVDEVWSKLAAAMESADRRARNRGPYAQLIAQVDAYLRFAMDSPTRYQILFTVQQRADGSDPDPIPVTRRMYTSLVGAVERCQQAGYRTLLPDTHDMAILVFVTAHGRVALSHSVPDVAHFSRPARIREWVHHTLAELVREPTPKRGRPLAK